MFQSNSITINPELQLILDACQKMIPSRPTKILIDATAGTGKTTALAHVHQKLESQGKNILPLSFSVRGKTQYNSIAKQHQLKLNGVTGEGVLCITLDALAFHIQRHHSINNNWPTGKVCAELGDIGLNQLTMLTVVNRINEGIAMREDGMLIPCNETDIDNLLELISTIKTSLIFESAPYKQFDEEEMDECAMEDIAHGLEDLGFAEWTYQLFQSYEKQRIANQLMMPVDYAYNVINEPEAIKAFCRSRSLDVVLVDEFHDTKPVHYQMLQAMMDAGVSLIAVGDESQDLFEFRQVRPFSAHREFLRGGAKSYPLTQTFRFGQTLADEISKQLKTMHREVYAKGASHNTAVIHASASPEEKAIRSLSGQTIERIRHAQTLMVRNCDIAVIFPSAQDSYATQLELTKQNIPHYIESMQPYYASSEAMFYRGVAWLCGWLNESEIKVADIQALELLIEMPRLKFSRGQMQALWSDLMEIPVGHRRPHSIRERQYKMDRFIDVLAEIREQIKLPAQLPLPFEEATIAQFTNCLGLHQWLTNKAPSVAARSSLKSSMSHFSGQLIKLGADAYVEQLDTVSAYQSQGEYNQRIVLTSVLQSKGADWPVVVMSAHWPAPAQGELSLLQKKERYVAMTRAKNAMIY